MSSYGGAWDGGPPGAEAEYCGPPQAAPPAPCTDPWTGVSYTHYAPPGLDYQAYGANYGYSYNPNYYHSSDAAAYYGKYPESRPPYPPAPHASYEYPQCPSERVPVESKSYERRKSYRSESRSASPYDTREQTYSRKRDGSYEDKHRHQRSRSRSSKPKRTKYSSDRSSSRSRSYSRSLSKKDKKKRSVSSDSSASDRSYKISKCKSRNHSSSPSGNSSRSRSLSRSRSVTRTPSLKRSHSRSRSPRLKDIRHSSKSKSHSKKDSKDKGKKKKRATPQKIDEGTPPRGHSKADRSSITPPRNYKRFDKSNKDWTPGTPHRKGRENSLTPPKSYARSQSSSDSKSRSRSKTPRHEKRKASPKSRSRSASISSSSSRSSKKSPSKTKRKTKHISGSRHRSRSKSRSKHLSGGKGSKSRRRSKSLRRSQSSRESRSHSASSRSRSASRTPTDDERRGQFTVADRKRYWKLHKSRQEVLIRERSPSKEVKLPPGALESTQVDDIEYGDPPEVEGLNFADLLPPVTQSLPGPSSSKSRAGPISIKNDGSFLEMFKKMQEETKKVDEKKPEIKKPILPFIGKRRGGRVLKTGMVKKAKAIDEQTVDNAPKDAWSLYMQEVKKYRETSCEEERKTRPLVK